MQYGARKVITLRPPLVYSLRVATDERDVPPASILWVLLGKMSNVVMCHISEPNAIILKYLSHIGKIPKNKQSATKPPKYQYEHDTNLLMVIPGSYAVNLSNHKHDGSSEVYPSLLA